MMNYIELNGYLDHFQIRDNETVITDHRLIYFGFLLPTN